MAKPDGSQPEGSLDEPEVPSQWGRYVVHGLLGDGGFARVYDAELLGPFGFRKPVALKVLRPDRAEHGEVLLAEARLGARLQHRNIVEIYDLGEVAGRFYIAMERVDGATAQELVRRHGALPPRSALDIAVQVCDALAYAHSVPSRSGVRQVVHRDVKPSNILVSRDGVVKLADFGTAHAQDAHAPAAPERAWGTPQYMAPEQRLTGVVDGRADLFALGVVLIELVLGRRPWRRAESGAAASELGNPGRALRAWGLVGELEAAVPGLVVVLERCLHRDPERRPASAGELRSGLLALTAGLPDGPPLATLVPAGASAVLDDGPPTVAEPEPAREDVPVEEPAPARTTNLLPPATALVGRSALLGRVLGALVGGQRWVTLVGAPGVGRSRVAEEAGRALLPRLPGGVWRCDCASDAVEVAVARALQVPLPPGDATAGLVPLLADRGDLLIILDDVGAPNPPVVSTLRTWLREVPGLRVIAVGERPLQNPAERVEGVEPLSADEAVALYRSRLDEVAAHRVADADLRVRVARLGGLPLAIELAAAQEGAPVDGGGALGPVLQQAWAALPEWLAAVLTQLTVFVGGFTVDAAARVVDVTAWDDAPWMLFAVEALLERGWVRPAPVGAAEVPRFELVEPVRRFCADLLAREGNVTTPFGTSATGPEAQHAAEARHGAWVASLDPTDAADLPLTAALSLADDLENAAEAVRRAVARGDSAVASRGAHLVARVVAEVGPTSLGLDLIAAAGAVRGLSGADRVALEVERGHLYMAAGRVGEARTVLEAARAAMAPAPVRARAGLALALALIPTGRGEEALDKAREACALLQSTGDDVGLALGRLVCGQAWAAQDRLAEAEVELTAAAAGLLACGRSRQAARAMAWRARMLHLRGDDQAAHEVNKSAMVMLRGRGDRRAETLVLDGMGLVLVELDRPADAERAFRSALTLARRVGDARAEAHVRCHLGRLLVSARLVEEGRAELQRATEQARAIGDLRLEAVAQAEVAALVWRAGEVEVARRRLDEAVEQLRRLDARSAEVGLLGSWAELEAAAANVDRARELLSRADALLQGTDYRRHRGRLALRRSRVEQLAGDAWAASASLDDARTLADLLGSPLLQREVDEVERCLSEGD